MTLSANSGSLQIRSMKRRSSTVLSRQRVREMAVALWGEAFVEARSTSSEYVDWRVSEANIASIRSFGELMRKDAAANAEILAWIDRIVAGMEAARAAGEPLWRQPADEAEDGALGPVSPRRRVRWFAPDVAAEAAVS